MILASGGAVHNLEDLCPSPDAPPLDYAVEFDRWLTDAVVSGRLEQLAGFRTKAPSPDVCHPYPGEHYLPLLVAAGAAAHPRGRVLHHSFLHGSLSMTAFQWE